MLSGLLVTFVSSMTNLHVRDRRDHRLIAYHIIAPQSTQVTPSSKRTWRLKPVRAARPKSVTMSKKKQMFIAVINSGLPKALRDSTHP